MPDVISTIAGTQTALRDGQPPGSITPQTVRNAVITLNALGRDFNRDSIVGKTICFVGDSTSPPTAAGFSAELTFQSSVGEPLEGVGITITSPAGAAQNATAVPITALPGTHAIPTGTTLSFNGSIVAVTTAPVAPGATTIAVSALAALIPAGATAPWGILNFGENGASLLAFLADGVTHGITAAIAAQAEMYVISYGINDVRLGLCDLPTMIARLTQAINAILAGVPTADIVLWMPPTFLTTDVNGSHFIQDSIGNINPAGAAQAYSTILRNAYLALANTWRSVYVLDTQSIFGITSPALSLLMADQLHPPNLPVGQTGGSLGGGQQRTAQMLAAIIGTRVPFSKGLADAARNSTPNTPETVYPRVVEDSDFYDAVAYGRYVGSGGIGTNAFVDFAWPGTAFKVIQKGTDFVQIGKTQPFVIPSGGTIAAIAANTRISNLGASLPPQAIPTSGTVTIFRPKYFDDANIKAYWQDTATYPYRFRAWAVTPGNGFCDLAALPGDIPILQRRLKVTDTLIVAGIAPVVLAGATFAPSGANLRISKGGTDFSAFIRNGCAIFGDAARQSEVLPIPPVSKFVSTAATGATLAAGDITGAASVSLMSTNAAPGNLTTRTATQMFNEHAAAQAGDSYNLRITQTGAGTLTLVAGAGVTLTGTMTVPTNTFREFVVTFTSATTLVIQAVGTGTYS